MERLACMLNECSVIWVRRSRASGKHRGVGLSSLGARNLTRGNVKVTHLKDWGIVSPVDSDHGVREPVIPKQIFLCTT